MSKTDEKLTEILTNAGANFDPYNVRSKRIVDLLPQSEQLLLFEHLLGEELTKRGISYTEINLQIKPDYTIGNLLALLPGDPFGGDGD